MAHKQRYSGYKGRTTTAMALIFCLFASVILSLTAVLEHSYATTQGPQAHYGFPAAGTRWQWKVTERRRTYTTMCKVLEDGVYEGRQVHRILVRRGDAAPLIEILDKETRCWITTLVNGKPMGSNVAYPHNYMFSWPLWVGKKWQASFTYDSPVTKKYRHNGTARVVAFEQVKVPAGTFETFKVVVAESDFWSITYWYDPKTRLIVKREDYGQQKGKRTSELTAYRIVE